MQVQTMLHGRMFAYRDAQRYRLGANHGLVEVNRPRPNVKVRNYFRDGQGVESPDDNGNGGPNYFPNSFDSLLIDRRKGQEATYAIKEAQVNRYDLKDEDNFSQAKYYWNHVFTEHYKELIAASIVSTLKDAYDFVQMRAVQNVDQVSPDLGKRLRKLLEEAKIK